MNAVSPGFIDTHWWNGMPDDQRRAYFGAVAAVTPVRRIGRPEDVADAIVYLAGAGRHGHRPGVHRRPANLTAAGSPADQSTLLAGRLTPHAHRYGSLSNLPPVITCPRSRL